MIGWPRGRGLYFALPPGHATWMTYTPSTKPRDHQVEALRRIKSRPRTPSAEDVFALLMEYGSGKSKVICDEWGEREEAGDLQDLLVVAGAGSYRNWDLDKNERQPSEFHRHLSKDLQDRMLTAAWVSGQGVRAKRELEHFLKQRDLRRPRALVVNIEALSTVQLARDMCREFLSTPGRRAMMVDDESTNIKSPDAKRTEYVVKMGRDAAARRILTGWVTPNSPMDLYSQFEFLDWKILGHKSFYTYKNRYGVIKKTSFLPGDEIYSRLERVKNLDHWPSGREDLVETAVKHGLLRRNELVELVVDYRNLEELQGKIGPYSYRVLKDECLDLPPKIYSPIIDVDMTDEQRRIYKELKTYATAKLSATSFVSAQLAITQMLRLQQLLVGHVVDEDGVEHDVPCNRPRALLNLLMDHSGKAIIWVPFQRTLDKVRAVLEKEYGPGSTAEFSGRNRSTRLQDEARWLSEPHCRFMVSTQAAGGKGNTWLPGTLVVYYANDYNLENRLNSEDRPHRDGQTQHVTYADFVCRGTVEDKVVPALRDKIDIGALIMGDGYKRWLV